MNLINTSSGNTQSYTVPFVAKNESVKISGELDHQYTPEEYLHQNPAHVIFTMGKQSLDPVACNQWHKLEWHIYIVPYLEMR